MATSNRRDVTLGIEVETTGSDGLRRLSTEVKALAKAGGDAAPAYAEAAAQLDRFATIADGLQSLKTAATDVDRLATQQAQAARVAAELAVQFDEQAQAVTRLKSAQVEAQQAVRQAQEVLEGQRSALRLLVAETELADRSNASFIARQLELKRSIEGSKAALSESRAVLAERTAETNAAARAEKAIATEYTAASRAAVDSTAALVARNAALVEARTALEALGQDTADLVGAEERLSTATRVVVDAIRAQQQAEVSAAAAIREAAEAADLATRAEQALFNIRKSASALELADKRKAEAAAAREAAEAATQAERAEQALFNIRKAAAALNTAEQRNAEAQAERASAESATLSERAQQALFNIRKTAGRQALELAAAEEKLAQETREAAAAADRRVQATREQGQADALAALEARGLAEAQQRAAAAAQSELAAIRESERFMERYATQAREAAIASGRLAASAQELSTAFGTTGLRSMQAIEAEIQRVERALTMLQAQARAGAISAQDLARATSSAELRLQQLRVEIERVPGVAGRFEALSNQVNGLINRFGALGAAVATVSVAVKPVLDATIALEQMNRVFVTITGSTREAANQIEFLRDVAQRSGQAVSAVGESYSKFVASASTANVPLAVTQKTFAAVAMAAGNLGLGSEQAKRALEALSQIASKGTVSMEELRQQLGDALPGVLGLLAERLGVTTGQLTKLVESGDLLAEEALPAIADGLLKLGPASGEVTGIVAEFNRLKNVVLEAGTIFTNGPFGGAIGVALKVIATAIGAIAMGVATISEAFRVAGVVIYETIQLIANRDMKAFKDAVGQATDESANRLANLANRFRGTSDASSELADAAKLAGTAVRASSAETAAASVVVGKSTGAVERHAEALAGVTESSNRMATATTALATAVASTEAPLTRTARSYSELVQKHNEQIASADKASSAARKHAEAVKESGEATVRAIAIAGDDVASKRAQADAASATAAATELQARADRRYADLLIQTRDARAERLRTDGATKERIEEVVKALNDKIVAANAEAEKSAAAAESARSEAAARSTVSAALQDNSARYAELTVKVDEARNEVLRLQTAHAGGIATTEQVTEGVRRLSEALALQNDALRDATRQAQLRSEAVRADNAASTAAITVREAEAQANLKVAQSINDTRVAAEREVEVKRIQIERVLATAKAKESEAAASIAVLERQRAEITGTDDLSVAKRQEIDIRIQNERTKIAEAKASEHVVRGIESEIKAIQNRNAAQAGSFSSSFDANKNNARSTVGGATYDDQGFATDPQGNRITAGTQLTPPDNSGDWEFVSDATANAGSQTITRNGLRVNAIGVARQGYWIRKSGGGGGIGGSTPTNPGASLGGLGAGTGNAYGALGSTPTNTGQSAPTTTGQSASTDSGRSTAQSAPSRQPVFITINGRTEQINVADADEAATLERVLRELGQAASRSTQ